MKSLNAGAPHFRSVAKQHRHANYTLKKVINEAVDNIKMVEKTVEYMQDNNHKVKVDNYDGSNKVSI